MTGIIDIGSNTIRLVTFDMGKSVSNIALNSEIIGDTENNRLSDEGIEKLCHALIYLKEKAGEIPVMAFATYAVRVLENREEVKNRVYLQTGIIIDILSGEEEAEYDFLGLKSTIGGKESGIGVDLGGGSGQIMIFKEGNLTFSKSYPIGCRRLKNKFVSGKFPTCEEKKKLQTYIKDTLEGGRQEGKIYMMGGTAKTAAKFYSYLNSRENTDILNVELLDRLIQYIEETPQEKIRNVLKNRYDNIVVGIIIMQTIAEYYGKREIFVKKCGVRDGYLIKNLPM